MDDFIHCHDDIAKVIACKPTNNSLDARDSAKLFGKESLVFPQVTTTDDLISLALDCDRLLYEDASSLLWDSDSFPFLQAMADLGKTVEESSLSSASTAAATLLALNGLESAIRTSAGFQTGRAPLLSTMISKIESPNTSSVCELLLLPKKGGGINLRNLLWHGFVPKLPRPWLALVLVVTWSLIISNGEDPDKDESVTPMPSKYPIMNLRSYPEFKHILENTSNCERPDSSFKSIAEWLPASHMDLFSIAVGWYRETKKPASTCAILCILLEHGLRLDWCHLNNRPQDAIARPNVFYVTLDGHGQRNVHDLLLHPYILENGRENLLVKQNLDGATTALLMDLFCSSCGGPNIRAAVSHGMWDYYLTQEWTGMPSTISIEDKSALWDTVRIVLVSMGLAATNASSGKSINYLPMFSFAAVTRQNLSDVKESLFLLEKIYLSEDYQRYAALAMGSLRELPTEIDVLKTNALDDRHLDEMLTDKAIFSKQCWTSVFVYKEHSLNQKLANSGATLVLLQDIATATNDHRRKLKESLELLKDDDENKRRRKTALRVVHSSCLAWTLYKFTAHVSILSLEQATGKDRSSGSVTTAFTDMEDSRLMLKAIERSRMVVSTFSSSLHTRIDRAVKSFSEYAKGKAVKAMLVELNSSRRDQKANVQSDIFPTKSQMLRLNVQVERNPSDKT